jgi:hypothetical protein
LRHLVPLASALVLVLGLAACDLDQEKPILMAAGSYGDVAVVVSDASLASSVEAFAGALNQEYTFVLERESLLDIDVYTPDKWELARGYKNIFFVWRVGDGGPVEKLLRSRLTDAGEQLVASGTPRVIKLEDPFANYQYAVIVAGTDANSLLSYLRRNAQEFRQELESESAARIMRRYRHEGLATQLMSDLWVRHRFYLEIPGDFRLNQETPSGYPAVELLQAAPSRGITVGWSQSVDPQLLLQQRPLLLELRKELGLKMHDEDVVPSSLSWSEDTLGGLPAVRLEGAWTSRRFDGGGPFWCWFVADPERQRVICVDVLCYAPGMEKMDFFRRLQAIVQTFSLQAPQT